MTTAADDVVSRAKRLSEGQRDAIGEWAQSALLSERYLALRSIYERARERGRYGEVVSAMDEAFRAVVASAGIAPYSYFAEDRGAAPGWEAAARLAAEVAAAEVAADLIPAETHELLVAPWARLTE